MDIKRQMEGQKAKMERLAALNNAKRIVERFDDTKENVADFSKFGPHELVKAELEKLGFEMIPRGGSIYEVKRKQ